MANYDYMDRGRITNGKGRLGTRMVTWDTDDADSGYINKSGKHREHVCRPVIVDPDGTMRPAVEFIHQQKQDATDPLLSKIEKLMEHVEPPPATLHMHSSATSNAWRKPSGEFMEKAKYEATSNVQTVDSGKSRTGFPSGMFRRHTPDSEYRSNNDIATNTWGRYSDGTENTSRSGWAGPSSRTTNFSTYGWGKPLGQIYDTGYGGWSKPSGGTYDISRNGWDSSGGSTYDTSNNNWSRPIGGTYDTGAYGWSKPTSATLHQPDYEDSYGKNGSTQKSGWSRPHHVSWATPTSSEIPQSRTSDISPIIATQQGLFSTSTPTYPRKEPVEETIDSKEARRRYGSLSATTPSIQEKYSTTIDSREAARKYNGSFV